MPLVKPPLAIVSPGQPVTAQAWNAILSGLGALYDAVLALGTNTLEVNVTDGAAPILDAQVVAVPASGAPLAAVPPRGAGTAFTLTNLAPGEWTVHVTARGYTAAQAPATIPATAPLAVTLTAATIVMPDLLGKAASTVVADLGTAGIQLDQILDVTGGEVSKTALPANRASSLVLFQFPLPGTRVTAASAKTRLLLSAEAEAQVAEVPSVVGMTYAQLTKTLTDAGLKVGNVRYLTTK